MTSASVETGSEVPVKVPPRLSPEQVQERQYPEADKESQQRIHEMHATRETEAPQAADARKAASGSILEAAFVDPAYSWPPLEGEGRNAIELQASMELLHDKDVEDDGDDDATTESLRQRMRMPKKPHVARTKWYQCCKNNDAVSIQLLKEYEQQKEDCKKARKEYQQFKKDRNKRKLKKLRQKDKYNRVPEGILIYRLDTSTHTLHLMSQPHSKTNMDTLVQELTIVQAKPGTDKSRRGMELTAEDGSTVNLVACEQRTATAWLESMNLMLAKKERSQRLFGMSSRQQSSDWNKEKLKDKELDTIEDQYVNLANYSNKLIRAGALPGGKKGSGGAGGIYYSVEKVHNDPWEDPEEEALEAIAKRRAVIKDSWDFYRMICSLLRDKHKYDEVFSKMQLDPVYPYLNSMTGLNDPGDSGYENEDKEVIQPDLPEYASMTKLGVSQALVMKAEAALPSLVEICKALAGSLGMEEVGVGPIKESQAAIRKAEKKYDGDLLKVTDYCRALLVVKDFSTLLALLELARDSFGPLIRRVKMSTLKADQSPKAGGYRDCIINVELKEHICEIQVHLWPMWTVCGVDGFRHYRHCLEYNTDSFDDAYEALDGLDRKTMAELIVMAEEAVAETPLDNLEWYHEKYILDYFAEAGLFMKHGLDVWAEITLRHLIRLRTESPDIGPEHHQTVVLYKYMAQCLRAQDKYKEASLMQAKVKAAEEQKTTEKKEAETTLWDSFFSAPNEAYDMLLDPNKKEREEEAKLRQDVKASKKAWRRIRHERFPFLDTDMASRQSDEKKSET